MVFNLGEQVECSVDNNKWEKCLYLFYQSGEHYAIQVIETNAVIRYFTYCRKIES